jgi:Ca2+-transporting ATPase
MRSLKGSIFTMKHQNLWLVGAGIISFLLTTAVVEIDLLAGIFDLSHLNFNEYLIAIGLAILTIPVVEIVKGIQRLINKK